MFIQQTYFFCSLICFSSEKIYIYIKIYLFIAVVIIIIIYHNLGKLLLQKHVARMQRCDYFKECGEFIAKSSGLVLL